MAAKRNETTIRASMEPGSITPQCFSITAQNPFSTMVSPNRNFMSASHIQQSVELLVSEPKITQSGLEVEIGKNTFSIEVERDCVVQKVIERSEMRGNKSIIVELIIIVRDDEDYIDYYRIPYHHSLHKTFGFKYVYDVDYLRSLRYGDKLKAGQILADTGANKDGTFTFGINANVALLSIDGVAEDAVIVSRSFADKMSFRYFKKTRVNFGTETFPLNMYGDENNYIPLPPIGELVREDGVLMALRKYENEDVMCNTSSKDLMKCDRELDIRYVVGRGGYTEPILGEQHETGKVVDVKAFRNDAAIKPKQILYEHTLGEINRHVDETERFYKEIYDYYMSIKDTADAALRYKNAAKGPIKFRDRARNLISRSFVIASKDGSKGGPKIQLQYKRIDQDIYSAEITTEHVMRGCRGMKQVDGYGSKGIIVAVWDDDRMPIAKDGTVADVIMDPSSVASRANVGRLYEQYFNGASRKLRDFVRAEKNDKEAWKHVMRFLDAYGTQQREEYAKATPQEQIEILNEIREKEFYLFYSVDNERKAWQIVRALEETPYRPLNDSVTLRHYAKHVETNRPCMIAPIYTMLLCKLGEDGMSGVSVPRYNHYHIPTNASNLQKQGLHIAPKPLKIMGETENRMVAAVAGPQATIELADRNMNMDTIKKQIDRILESDTNFPDDLNYDRSPETYGKSRVLELLKHVFSCGGIGIRYAKDENNIFDETCIPGIGLKKADKNSQFFQAYESKN